MILTTPRHRKGSPMVGGVDVNWNHPFFKGATFIFIQHGKQVWVNGKVISAARSDYSGITLRGNGGKPIRLCGSPQYASLYPVPSSYTLNCTLVMQGVLARSICNTVDTTPNYYGCWYNVSTGGSVDVSYGQGGAGSTARKTCNFLANAYDTIATSTYGNLDPVNWNIFVEGVPASSRTYSGAGTSFASGSGSGANFSHGWDPSVSLSKDTRTGIFIYMNKSLSAEELASLTTDIYQLFTPAKFYTFFDIPKESVKLPAVVPYKRRPANSSDGLVKVSKRYKTKFAVSAAAGFTELVTGKHLSQELAGPALRIRKTTGKYPGLMGNPIGYGMGGLDSNLMVPLKKSMTIAFCMTTRPSQELMTLMGSLSEFIDDPTYASSFVVFVNPAYETVSLMFGLSDGSINASHLYESYSTIFINSSLPETTGMYAFQIDANGNISAHAGGRQYGDISVAGSDFLFPDTVGEYVETLRLISSGLLSQGMDKGMLHAVVITDGLDGDALTANIWDAFEGPVDLPDISPHTPVVAMQSVTPASDISAGGWTPSTGTTLYGVLDETSADDSDYITTDVATTCEVKLAAAADPLVSNNHSITYRLLPGIGNITAALKCGSVTIASWGPHVLTGATQEFTQVLSGGQADSITDYADLRVVFTSS